ncbi:putative invertase inhibitor [Pistacia vera]|uniref:putative invertase inhibitor n=1 Tax=Pistacia vera TaxID=55513 RepID=UPI001263C732|nr:putative invertase inhibitor [Pistacia vera]
MWHLSFFFLFFFILTSPNYKTFTSTATSLDILDQTCRTCADRSIVFSYNVCLTSLQTIPVCHATNLQGLALIAMELALENATTSISTINKLLTSGTLDPFALACLEDCLKLYSSAVVTLIDATGAFLTGEYGIANVWLTAVMEASTTCEEGFSEREEMECPLKKENYNLFQLCDIALCIINLLSLHVNS